MTMQSSSLLPALRELPGDESSQNRSFRETITGIVNMDRAMYAAEFASGASFGLWAIFDRMNVDDTLAEAYAAQYPGLASDHSLHEHWTEIMDRGPESMEGFINGLKGKIAELDLAERLEQSGFTNVEIATDPTQSVWDIRAVSPEGEAVLIQVKTGAAEYASEVQDLIADNPGIQFAVSSEIYDQLDVTDRLARIGSSEELTGEIRGRLDALLENTGLEDTGLTQAYQMTNMHQEGRTLIQHWQEIVERGSSSETGFISNLKGKVAEVNFAEQLKSAGSTVEIHPNPQHPVSDILELRPDGESITWQVKTGEAERAGEILDLVENSTDIHFALGDEIYSEVYSSASEIVGQMTGIGPDYLLVEGITDGLNTLSSNLGIDVPDGVVDIVPYAGAIIAGARLVHSVLKTEKEFKAVDRTTKNKIQVIQSLTLMSRIGVTTAMATAGGIGGGAVGSVVPVVGNLVGGIVGSFGGAGIGMYLNRHLQPHMLNLALNITGMTNDDLFYYKNKVRIDNVALGYQERAIALAAPA